VLGDSGVGKSRLVKRIITHFGGECAHSDDTTVGAHIESVAWPSVAASGVGASSSSGPGTVLEIVEIGGNRGFSPAARKPFYSQRCDGVLIVYSERNVASKRSLLSCSTNWWIVSPDGQQRGGRQRVVVVVASLLPRGPWWRDLGARSTEKLARLDSSPR